MFYKTCIIIIVIKHTSKVSDKFSSSTFFLEKFSGMEIT